MGCAQSRHQAQPSLKPRLSRVPYGPDLYTAQQQFPRGGWGHYHTVNDSIKLDSHYGKLKNPKYLYYSSQPKQMKRKMPQQPRKVHTKSKPQVRTRDNRSRPNSLRQYPTVAEIERSMYWGPPHRRMLNQQSGDSMRDVDFRYENAYTHIAGHRPGQGQQKRPQQSKPTANKKKDIWSAVSALSPPPQARRGIPNPRKVETVHRSIQQRSKQKGALRDYDQYVTDYMCW